MTPKLPAGFSRAVPIGEGAFAAVVRARQDALDRQVALKFVARARRDDRASLLREATTLARLHVEGVPGIYDAFEWRGGVCIVMEWIHGVPLSGLLEAQLADDQRLFLARQVTEVLARLHAEGLAHRDIKPDNIMVTPAGVVYLVDFGFAKHASCSEPSVEGHVKGTPRFMAPELWQVGANVDQLRVDVYALGKVLGLLLGTRAPAVVMQCCADDPLKRPASAVAVLAAWDAAGVDAPATPGLAQIAARLADDVLARSLVHAAADLLARGRHDDAYWLLVEALEHNPEANDALELMQAFPRASHLARRRRRLAWAAGLAAGVCLAAGGYLAGRGSASDGAGAQQGQPAAQDLRVATTTPRDALPARAGEPLKQAGRRTGLLAGALVIAGVPGPGTLLVDGAEHPSSGAVPLQMEYGEHALAWRDTVGNVVWRQQVRLLPFQTVALCVRER